MFNFKLFEKRKVILTEWNNSIDDQMNFQKAIRELKEGNIRYEIAERRMITEYAKKLYFSYSLILDFFLLLTFWQLFPPKATPGR